MSTIRETDGFDDYVSQNQEHKYDSVSGLVVLPVASRTAAHRIIRLHGGYATRTVTWSSSRNGRPPVMPAAADTSGDTLIATTIAPMHPRPNEQATGYDWKVSGVYTYVQNTPRVPGVDAFPVGDSPYTLSLQSQMAEAIGGDRGHDDFDTYYTTVGADNINATGSYLWPFLALAPASFSDHILQD